MKKSRPTRKREIADDDDFEVITRDSHWHHTMVVPRFWGMFDLRASIAGIVCFFQPFDYWWSFKLPFLGITVFVSMALEARRVTPEVALRQLVAWLRGPRTPGIASRHLTTLSYRPPYCPPRTSRRPVSNQGRLR